MRLPLFILLLIAIGSAQTVPTGVAVGSRVPDFALIDQHGESRTLETVRGSKGTMLVFFRSADW